MGNLLFESKDFYFKKIILDFIERLLFSELNIKIGSINNLWLINFYKTLFQWISSTKDNPDCKVSLVWWWGGGAMYVFVNKCELYFKYTCNNLARLFSFNLYD